MVLHPAFILCCLNALMKWWSKPGDSLDPLSGINPALMRFPTNTFMCHRTPTCLYETWCRVRWQPVRKIEDSAPANDWYTCLWLHFPARQIQIMNFNHRCKEFFEEEKKCDFFVICTRTIMTISYDWENNYKIPFPQTNLGQMVCAIFQIRRSSTVLQESNRTGYAYR